MAPSRHAQKYTHIHKYVRHQVGILKSTLNSKFMIQHHNRLYAYKYVHACTYICMAPSRHSQKYAPS